MAYLISRKQGRFEIRESVHTRKGPRAYSLANFAVLNDEVLAKAAGRATRPFDRDALVASAKRKGVPIASISSASERAGPMSYARFLEASRRMARTAGGADPRPQPDPGRALMELLAFADAVTQSRGNRPREELAFPPLARLRQSRPEQGGSEG